MKQKRLSTSTAAYIGAVLFAIHLVTYFIPAIRDVTTSSSIIGAEALALLAVFEHLVLFTVIAALPAPRWAQAAGYGWLVLDIATDIMQLNGVEKLTYLGLRYGANVAAAIWIASAAWQARGAMRVIGVIVAIDLVIYSFIAFVPFTFLILIPSLVLLPLWLIFIGRSFSSQKEEQGDYIEVTVGGKQEEGYAAEEASSQKLLYYKEKE